MDHLRHFGFLLKDVSRLSSKNFERHAMELSLTVAQCKVLVHLERNEGVSQVRLAELTDTEPMTLVRILDRMERDGWVERRADPADRRARKLFLKDAATPVLQETWRIVDRARAEAMAGISIADREHLMNLMTRIQGNLVALLPCGNDTDTDRPGAGDPCATAVEPIAPPSPRSLRAKKKFSRGEVRSGTPVAAPSSIATHPSPTSASRHRRLSP